MAIGSRIKAIAKHKGITLKQLAEKSGISYNTIYSITKRDSDRVQGRILMAIASAMEISPSYFYMPDLIKTVEDGERALVRYNQSVVLDNALNQILVSLYGERSERDIVSTNGRYNEILVFFGTGEEARVLNKDDLLTMQAAMEAVVKSLVESLSAPPSVAIADTVATVETMSHDPRIISSEENSPAPSALHPDK